MKRTALLFSLIAAALLARADYGTLPVEADEAMGDYIRFESRPWAAELNGEGGRLSANATWNGGEYIILNDLYVPSGVTLTIGPGTKIRFCEGTRIKVEDGGQIVFNGENGNEVVLTGYDDDTDFEGITFQSGSAGYSDNDFVVAEGFAFGKFATVSLSDTTAFVDGGQAIVPVTVSGSRDRAFSFDWVAETNGVAFASGTMNWSRVGDGSKNIVVPFDGAFAALESFTVRASLLRCCTARKAVSVVTLSEFITSDIQTDEAMGDFIRFESRDWTTNFTDMANVEGGRLTENTVWSGEHVIVGNVYIPSGVTLTLTADTVVRFCEGTMIKIEDGGTLRIVGADGHDVVLCGYEDETEYAGVVRMSSGTLTDNSYVRVDGPSFGNLAKVALNDSDTFRTSGLALIPVTVSGSRDSPFSIDWVAETNGVPCKTGTVRWNRVGDGTKNIAINYGAELDGLSGFTVRVAVHRACFANPGNCRVTIRDFDVSDIQIDEAMGDFIRFESRDWTTNFIEVVNVEGGRLTENTVWSGEHVIMNDVYIPSGVTLTITADALVRLCEGTMIKIEDGGTLRIVGADGHDAVIRNFDEDTTSRGIVKMPSGNYSDNMYVQYPDFRYGSYPNVTLHDAAVGRDAGKVYVPLTLGGSSRDQSFNVDWETDKGASGTVTWSRSGDGTKWIELPVDAAAIGGTETYDIRLTAGRGANLAVAEAKVTIYEFDHPVTESVIVAEGTEPSNEFAVHGGIKFQPIFLNETEEVRYSGWWQDTLDPESVISRISVESDNGITRLGEWSGSEEGAIPLNLADYNVGRYTLRHEIVQKGTDKILNTLTKTFSVVDRDDVELHGGTLTGNETWKAGKVHVVYEPVVVPGIYTLFIEPGAIVKFMTGTGIDISQGGALFANAIVFTHINDDTVGGDTLSDGYTVAPPMDAYFLSGNFTFGDDAELRNVTQKTALTGTLNGTKMLSKGSTYRVSGTFTVANGATLTIPAGTVLKMEQGAQIVVNAGGTLKANGTRAAPVVFTSINDDSYSGKTEGSNSNPQPGDWKRIDIAGTATFDFTRIAFASDTGDRGAINGTGGTITFDNGVVESMRYECVRINRGSFVSRNSVFRDAAMGFGYYGGSGTYVYNGVVADCTIACRASNKHFVNTVFYNCLTFLESTSSSADHCAFYNPPDWGAQTATQVGKNGNIWGDPLFVDPANGDFRIREGSPCVDAADSSAAPELDYFGQPRITFTGRTNDTELAEGPLADIGICEVMPRDVTSDIDLVPEAVRTEKTATPGQLLFVKWEVRNQGGAPVDATWRDTVSLVSQDGREVVLGDKTAKSAIAVGGSVFCSGYFTVPAMAEGTWYPKVNVNSYHDIFEGSLTANNALVGAGSVEVAVKEVESEGEEGVVNAGAPTVKRITLPETGGNRMVRIKVPAGVTIRWGFGFVPTGNQKSGTLTSNGQDVLFRVPDGVTDVYVSMESDDGAEYDLSLEEGQVVITSVSPNTLPSSGEVTITIDGAGFTEDSKVYLVKGATQIAPESALYVNSQQFVVTVDCGKLTAGATYDVSVSGEANTSVLPQAVSVASAKGEGRLEARLILPESARQGRIMTGYIEYSNVGTADMNAPIFIVKGSMNGTLVGLTSDVTSMTNQIKLVGISGSYPAGKLKVGETARQPFYCRLAGNYAVDLVIVDDSSELQRKSALTSWTDFCDAISEAATRLALARCETDYDSVYAHAMRAAYGMNVGVIAGTVSNARTGEPIAGASVLVIATNGHVAAGAAISDSQGRWSVVELKSGESYEVMVSDCNNDACLVALPDNGYAACALLATPCVEFSCCVVGLGDESFSLVAMPEFSSKPVQAKCREGNGSFESLADGTYTISGGCDALFIATNDLVVVVSNGVALCDGRTIGFTPCGEIDFSLRLADGAVVATNVLVEVADGNGNLFTGVSDTTGHVCVKVLPGQYSISVNGDFDLQETCSGLSVSAGERKALELTVVEVPFSAFPSAGPKGLTSEFYLSATNRWPADASFAWDLDGDGVIDSHVTNPTWTYAAEGEYDVTLTVIADGRKTVYRKRRAVDVWGASVKETWSDTLTIDDRSGMQVVEDGDDFILLASTGDGIAGGVWPGRIVVVPGDELRPRKILTAELRSDNSYYCTTEFTQLTSAYKVLRTSVAYLYASAHSTGVAKYKTYKLVDNSPKITFPHLDIGKHVTVTPDFAFPMLVSVDVADGEVHRFVASIGVKGQLDVAIKAPEKKRPKADDEDRVLVKWDSPKPLPPLCGIPQHLSLSCVWEASVKGKGTIHYAWDRKAELRWSDDGTGLHRGLTTLAHDFKVTGTAEAEVKAGLALTWGIGVASSDMNKYADVANLTFSAGGKLKMSKVVEFDETKPDEYSFYAGPFLDGEFNLGDAKWKNLRATLFHKPFDLCDLIPDSWKLDWSWKTPMPAFSTDACKEGENAFRVDFRSRTNVPKDSKFASRRWDVAGKQIGVDETASYVLSVEPDDEVTYDVSLYEGYVPQDLPAPFVGIVAFGCEKVAKSKIYVKGNGKDGEPVLEVEKFTGTIPQSCDPNEMSGPLGLGDPETERYVKPGEWMTYTVYFENRADATAAAQEVRVTNPLSEYLDWSTFEMGEIAFKNQIDLGLSGKRSGTSEAVMKGTNTLVRTQLTLDDVTGTAEWYLRIVDPTTATGWPEDVFAGFLPPNDETFRGEGHLTYRVKVRDDAPHGVRIDNSASIVFDYNEPIETDPSWWNMVARTLEAGFVEPEVMVDEGGTATIAVRGGSAERETSVQVSLAYQTASAADLDLKNAKVDGATPKGGVKFPLTLTWAAGEIGAKTITIPVKADRAVENEELFTLQLANAQGMGVGDASCCTVTIRDANAAADYAAKQGKTTVRTKKGVPDCALSIACVAMDGSGEPCGFTTGQGSYYTGCKASLKATARPGWTFAGWGEVEDGVTNVVSDKASWSVAVTDDADIIAFFDRIPYVRGLAHLADRGKVTGSGYCPAGKKVTLRATANRGYVFEGWYKAKDGNAGEIDLSGQPVAKTAALIVDRTARPAKSDARQTVITEVDGSVTYFAKFITNQEDIEAVSLDLDGVPLSAEDAFATNLICGVAVDWPVVSGGLSATTVRASGLPAGLKLVQDKKTTAYSVVGVPTTASKVDKSGNVKPSVAKFTVTTAGRNARTFVVEIAVSPLPTWAVGSFDGAVQMGDIVGAASMTVAANGRVSGKYGLCGTNWTFSASGYTEFIDDDIETNCLFALDVMAKSGRMLRDLRIEVTPGWMADIVAYRFPDAWIMEEDARAYAESLGMSWPYDPPLECVTQEVSRINCSQANGADVADAALMLHRGIWKDYSAKSREPMVDGLFDWWPVLEPWRNWVFDAENFPDVKMSVATSGRVSFAGKLPDGVRASSSTTAYLVPESGHPRALFIVPTTKNAAGLLDEVVCPHDDL